VRKIKRRRLVRGNVAAEIIRRVPVKATVRRKDDNGFVCTHEPDGSGRGMAGKEERERESAFVHPCVNRYARFIITRDDRRLISSSNRFFLKYARISRQKIYTRI